MRRYSDRAVGHLALAAHERHERARRARRPRRAARAPMTSASHCACAPTRAASSLAAGAVQPRDLRRRPVGEEVEDGERGRQHRRRDRERGELRRAEVADDRGVDEHVERLGGERAERRHGEPEDLAVVGRAPQHVA